MSAPTSTYGDEIAAITGHLQSNWARTPIQFPNAHLDPGEEPAFVRVQITHQPAFNVEITSTQKTVRHPGLLTMQVRTRRNQGDGLGIDYGDDLAGLFRNLALDPRIYFRAPTVNGLGSDGSGWDVTEVTCPFYRDSMH